MYINKLTRLVNVVWFSCQLFQFFYSARPDWSLNVLVPHTFLLQNFHLLKSTHIMVIVKKPEMDKKNQGNEKKKIAEDHWRPEINHQRFHSFHIFVFFAVGRCNLSLGISVVQKKKNISNFPPKVWLASSWRGGLLGSLLGRLLRLLLLLGPFATRIRRVAAGGRVTLLATLLAPRLAVIRVRAAAVAVRTAARTAAARRTTRPRTFPLLLLFHFDLLKKY